MFDNYEHNTRNYESVKFRECWKCKNVLTFEDFKKRNLHLSTEFVNELWNNIKLEFHCDKCYHRSNLKSNILLCFVLGPIVSMMFLLVLYLISLFFFPTLYRILFIIFTITISLFLIVILPILLVSVLVVYIISKKNEKENRSLSHF